MVAVIQRNRHIGIAQRFSQFGTGKNNVLHRCAAQLLDSLLAQHPAHGVCNITLSAAVWSDNTGDSVVELKQDFIGKGFKPVYFYTLLIHIL